MARNPPPKRTNWHVDQDGQNIFKVLHLLGILGPDARTFQLDPGRRQICRHITRPNDIGRGGGLGLLKEQVKGRLDLRHHTLGLAKSLQSQLP